MSTRLTPVEILDYEVAASWWVGFVGIEWMQELASRYFAWKVRRKYRRYVFCKERAERLLRKYGPAVVKEGEA